MGVETARVPVAWYVCVFVVYATPSQVSKGTGTVIISCFVGAYEIWAN